MHLYQELGKEAGIIPFKLKRRLQYKGHHLHQNIRPATVQSALSWLIKNYKFYQNIKLNLSWEKDSNDQNAEMWESLMNDLNNNESRDSDKNECPDGEDEDEFEEEDLLEQLRGVQYDTCMYPNDVHSEQETTA